MSRTDTGPFSIVPNWLIEVASPTAVVVYLSLARYADNETNRCWPSQKELAATLNVSVATIKRGLKELRDVGALEAHQRHREDGSLTSSEYVLLRIDPRLRTDQRQSTSEPTSEQIQPDVNSQLSEQEELYPINYTQLTKPNELDIATEQNSAAETKRTRERDLLFEAVCQACHIDWKELTPSGRGAVGKAVKELKSVGAKPEEVWPRREILRKKFSVAVTPSSLAKHWASLVPVSVLEIVTDSERTEVLDRHRKDTAFDAAFSEQKALGQ